MTQEPSTTVNTLFRLENNEHHINQRLVITRAYSFNCLAGGKNSTRACFIKRKVFLANIVFLACLRHLQHHGEIIHLTC